MTEITIQEDDTYVLHGPEPSVPLFEDATGIDILRSFSAIPKGTVAMIDAFTHEKLIYSDLFQRSVDLATALRHHDYSGQNTVLSISSENCLDFFIPVFASIFNGSIMAPLNHAYTPYELEHAFKISHPKVVFCSEEVAQKMVDLKKNMGFIERIITLGNKTTSKTFALHQQGVESIDQFIQGVLKGRNADVSTFQPVAGDVSNMAALIMCSSGTTGLPKGVCLSQRCLNVRLAHSRDTRYWDANNSSKSVLGLVPFFHGYGLLMIFSSLVGGETVICLKRFDEDVFLRSIQDYRISVLMLAPPLVILLTKTKKIKDYDLSCVKSIVCGAAPLSKSSEEELTRRLKGSAMRQGYGLTEITLAVTMVNHGEAKPGSCGKIMSFVSGKVRDPATGRSLGPNEVGELCWKSPMLMMGYYKNEQATRDTFTSDGWLKSGDLGYYDAEGYFYIIDRLKELIKYKGYQVAPAELEAVLINHPKVNDVGVVGLPDELVGERPLAFIVKKPGLDVTEEEVKKYVADTVSSQKRLTGGVIFVDSIPKNPSGKILRRELREILKKYSKTIVESKL